MPPILRGPDDDEGAVTRGASFRTSRRSRGRAFVATLLALLVFVQPALGSVVPQTMNGVPAQVIPMVAEIGAPQFSVSPGTVANGTGGPGGAGSGTGADGSDLTGDGTGTDAGTGSTVGSGGDYSATLDQLTSQSWGAAAAANATALGVTPVALATTCVLESGCNANTGGSGTISGAFQMSNATYTSMIQNALARDPSLASDIVPGLAGKLDPATQSIAASEYLYEGAQALQNANVTPTDLAVRGYYNYGPTDAVAIARAPGSTLMSDVVGNLTPAQMQSNGITPWVTTVEQWRASVINTIGSAAANASVLASN